jgi:hypothetical protein
MRGLSWTSGVSLLVCVLGCALLFVPWVSASIAYVDPTPQSDGTYKAKSMPAAQEVPAYRLWQGVGSAAAFLGVVVFLVVTGPLRPDPWWQSAVVMAVGTAITAAIVLGMRQPPGELQSDLEAGRLVFGLHWEWANYTALGCAVALMLVAALGLRRSIARAQGAKEIGGTGDLTASAGA